MITADDVIAATRCWLGVPFLHQGRSRAGVDCIGLFIAVSREVGIVAPTFDHNRYSRLPNPDELMAAVTANCTPSASNEPGGLLVMRFRRYPQHFALLTREATIIHAFLSVRKVVEVGFRTPWPQRVLSCWRLPGVHYE